MLIITDVPVIIQPEQYITAAALKYKKEARKGDEEEGRETVTIVDL